MTLHTVKGDTITASLLKKAEKYLRTKDKRLKPLLEKVGACTLQPTPDTPFQVLLRSIISQQLSNKAADTIEQRLLQQLNMTIAEPTALLALSIEQLRSVGLSAAKARYIRELATVIVSGELQLADLSTQNDTQVIQTLTQYPGIGQWTAEMFLIFALGRPDVLAVNDLGLRRGVQIVYELPEKPTKSEFEQISQIWRPYRTIASWYLWRVID